MEEIKNVSLSFCCKEDWNSFTRIGDRIRFCGSCQHKVMDFTNASQSDFNRLMDSDQKICGRFKQSQMSESFLRMTAASLMIAAATTAINCTEPENIKPKVQKEESSELELTGVVMGIPALPNSMYEGSSILPIVVADATKGEEPIRYNPLIPSTGNYKKSDHSKNEGRR